MTEVNVSQGTAAAGTAQRKGDGNQDVDWKNFVSAGKQLMVTAMLWMESMAQM